MKKAAIVSLLAIAVAVAEEHPPAKVIPAGPVTIDPKNGKPKIHDKSRMKSLIVKRYGPAKILDMPVPMKQPAR